MRQPQTDRDHLPEVPAVAGRYQGQCQRASLFRAPAHHGAGGGIRDVHRGGQSAQPQQYPIIRQQLLPHRRRQATRQDDRGVLPGGQKGDRAIPGAGGLLHPVRLQQPLHHGAMGCEDPDAGGKETPLRGHPAP